MANQRYDLLGEVSELINRMVRVREIIEEGGFETYNDDHDEFE